MKYLLFGVNGQVGYELQRAFKTSGELISLGRKEINLENEDSLRSIIQKYKPKVILNAAAYTGVDAAESDEQKAYKINVEAVDIMANEIKKLNGILVQYSSDYVFDGKKHKPYIENDQTNPLSVYGETKLQSERSIIESGCNYLIFRTSWVYGFHGNNFIKTILRLAKEKDELSVVNDQFGIPTSAEFIADITYKVINELLDNSNNNKVMEVYNLVPLGETTWFHFAKKIISEAKEVGFDIKLKSKNLIPIKSINYPQDALRPSYSVLSSKKINETFEIDRKDWETDFKKVIKDLYYDANSE